MLDVHGLDVVETIWAEFLSDEPRERGAGHRSWSTRPFDPAMIVLVEFQSHDIQAMLDSNCFVTRHGPVSRPAAHGGAAFFAPQ
jgi:hypothetical protein